MKSLVFFISCSTVLFTSWCLAAKESTESSSPFPTVPLIDLKGDRHVVARQIHEACRTVGFFMIQNHGLNENVIDETWKVSQAFFDLPQEEKTKHKTTNEAEYPYGFEQSEQLTKGKQLDGGDGAATVDLKETFAIGPNNLDSGMPLRRWIDTPSVPMFRSALEEYYSQMENLALKLLEMFAMGLDEPSDFFVDKMDHHMSALRLVNYFPLSEEQQQNTDGVRAGAHTDYGALTILNAKEQGLQVMLYDLENRTNTQWYSVPVVPDSLIINLGDLIQRWTNDKWVSTLHRVVIPPTVERRYSMAYFVNINGDTLVETLGADKAKYPPITAKEHLMVKHLASMSEAKHDEL